MTSGKLFWPGLIGLLLTAVIACPGLAAALEPILRAGAIAPSQAAAGQEFDLELPLEVANGYHINSTKPEDESLIPTSLELADNPHFRLLGQKWPKPIQRKFPYTDSSIPVFEGKMRISLRVAVAPGTPAGDYNLRAIISYQGCSDEACLMPDELALDIPVKIAP
jgi:hypothetical protein